jgi:hypothetical protein
LRGAVSPSFLGLWSGFLLVNGGGLG